MLSLSVVVCTYNRHEFLRRGLIALHEVVSGDPVEVLVVDNNSTDQTSATVEECRKAFTKHLRISYLMEKEQGLSPARNRGLREASGEIVGFLDDDAIVCAGWLDAVRKTIDGEPKHGVIGGPIEPIFEAPRPPWLGAELEGYYSILDLGESPREFPRGRYPFGANMAFRRSAIEGLGFPVHLGRRGGSLMSGEERWFIDKVRRRGWTVAYEPAMRVRHHVPAERLTENWLLRRCYAGGVSKILAAETPGARWNLYAATLAKRAYLALAGSRCMLDRCRERSVQGAYDALRDRIVWD